MFDLYQEENERIIQERLIGRVKQYLNLERLDFKLSYKGHKRGYAAIFNSPFCRLRFGLDIDPRERDDSISISYGRVHAPDEEYYMVYRGENCLAWHSFMKDYIGQFLDGAEPRTLARARMDRISIPSRAREAFEKSKTNEELSSPIWGLRLTAFTWEYYGISLFKLFDLRYPERWDEYRYFLSEFYDELSKEPNWRKLFVDQPEWKPSPWQVC